MYSDHSLKITSRNVSLMWEYAKMEYTYITQDEGLLVVASCFAGDITLAEGPTTVARINSKGVVIEEHRGFLFDRDFYEGDRCYRVSN